MDDATLKRLTSATLSPHHPWWEQQYRSESMSDVMRLLTENVRLRDEDDRLRAAMKEAADLADGWCDAARDVLRDALEPSW